jgi:hypothetical protein
MLWPLTITCIDESGNRLPGAAIQVRDNLNPSVSVPVYDSAGQLVASPVAGPTGMATVFLRNGYIDSRYVLDPYESEWITDLALAPFGRAGRWRDDVGGAIAAGATTDFTITVPNLGDREGPPRTWSSRRPDASHMEDLTLQLVRTGIPVEFGGPDESSRIYWARARSRGAVGGGDVQARPGRLLGRRRRVASTTRSARPTRHSSRSSASPTALAGCRPTAHRERDRQRHGRGALRQRHGRWRAGSSGTTAVGARPGCDVQSDPCGS